MVYQKETTCEEIWSNDHIAVRSLLCIKYKEAGKSEHIPYCFIRLPLIYRYSFHDNKDNILSYLIVQLLVSLPKTYLVCWTRERVV